VNPTSGTGDPWKALFEDLLEHAHEGVWALDPAGTTVFVSAKLAAQIGYSAEDLAGRPFADFVAPPDHDTAEAPPTREGKAVLLRRRDGSRFWASVATIPFGGADDAERGSVHLVSDLTRRIDAEARLREGEARFRALFEANPQPMWIYDLETLAFLDVNDAAAARYGYSREEFLSMTLRDIRPPEDVAALERNIASITNGLDLAGVWRHRRKDGSILLAEITSHTLDFSGRRAECVVAHDVTERRKAEQALLAVAAGTARCTGEAFLRSAVHHLASALGARWALVGELLPGSPERVRTLAVWSGDGIAPNFEYPLAGSPCERVVGRGVSFLARGVRETYPDHPVLNELGVEAFFGAALSDSAGQPLGILAVLHDRPLEPSAAAAPILAIYADRFAAEMERARAEDALRQSEATTRAILDAMPDEMLFVRRDGAIREMQARSGGLLDAASAESEGASLSDVLPAPLAETTRARLDVALRRGEAQTWEQEIRRDAEIRVVEVRLVPRGPDDALAVVRDVTERRRLDERIRHAQKLEGLEVLAGGIAHDFNNLLASVMGHAGLTLAHLPGDSPLRPYIRSIELAAQRGAELTRQMLAYSGRGRLVIERIHLGHLVEETVHLLRAVVTKSATLDLDLPRDLPWIEGDATQIRQVLMNLITNASDAVGQRPGTITVRVAARPGERELPNAGDVVLLEVSDTGCGMDDRTKERLFDPFFTTKFTGRGLGLAAVRGIVRAHRGTIRVESEPGRGSRFQIQFPSAGGRAERTGADDDLGVRGDLPATEGGLLLVADDEADVREMARTILAMQGWSILEAADGLEAVRIFREHADTIRLVLLDLTMPNVDGAEALRRIQATRPDARVILTSGYGEGEVAACVDRSRLAGFLQKPYHARELVDAVRAAIAGRAADEAAARS
jgi:PAS domain S-box-containing protein